MDDTHLPDSFTTGLRPMSVQVNSGRAPGPAPEPRRIRVYLLDGVFYDMNVTAPWPEWVQQMNRYGGILFEDGWIPQHFIKLMVPAKTATETAELPPNVVPFPPQRGS